MPTTTGTRRKQFIRKTETRFQPVADDYAILDLARRHRLITIDHVHAVLGHRSRQGLGRRITKLFDVGWLEKSRVQNREHIEGGGSHPHSAALTSAGYEALAQKWNLPLSSTRWDWNNKTLRSTSVPHILETTRFAVLVRRSTQRHADRISADLSLELLEELPHDPPRKSKPLSYVVEDIRWQGRTSSRGIEPDELLRLTYAHLPPGKNVAPFVVEIDRAKETIDPENLIAKEDFWRQSSILKKDVIYINDFHARTRRPTCGHFGLKVFRPLYVTTDRAHMKKMQECEQKYFSDGPLRIRPGFILYTNWQDIEAHNNDVLAMPWFDRLGRDRYIDGVSR